MSHWRERRFCGVDRAMLVGVGVQVQAWLFHSTSTTPIVLHPNRAAKLSLCQSCHASGRNLQGNALEALQVFVVPYSMLGKTWRRVRKAGAYHKPRSLLATFFSESLNRTSTSRTTLRKEVQIEKYKMNHFRNAGDLTAGALLKIKFLVVSSPPILKSSLHVPIFSPDSAKAVTFPPDIPKLITPQSKQSKHNPRSQDLYFAELVRLNATPLELQAHAESGGYAATPWGSWPPTPSSKLEVGVTTTNLHITSSFFAGKKLRRVGELSIEARCAD